jgi:hypothetical protein
VIPTVSSHQQAAQELARLHESQDLLVQRLERILVALALTLDAQAAAEERLDHLQNVAGMRRIRRVQHGERTLLAQRYRDVIHAIHVINAEVALGNGSVLHEPS